VLTDRLIIIVQLDGTQRWSICLFFPRATQSRGSSLPPSSLRPLLRRNQDRRIGGIRSLAPGIDQSGRMPDACNYFDRVGAGTTSISDVFHHDRPTVSCRTVVRGKLAAQEASQPVNVTNMAACGR